MRKTVCSIALALAGALLTHAQPPKASEVAPGITLPANGDATVLVLDSATAGPALVHIPPHEVVLSSHATSNFFRGMVYSGPHMTAELDGVHAESIVSSTKAVFFVRLTGDSVELARSRVHLLWLHAGKKRREITDFSMNVFGGQRTRDVDEVPCNTEMVEGTNWLKVTPKDQLLPGEFAVVFMPKGVNQQPGAVFDFSVPGGSAKAGNPYAPKPAGSADTK